MRLRIFTDGACSENPGPGGWSAVFNLENDSKVISGFELKTTNNQMELLAVVKALKAVHKKHDRFKEVEIHSDSAYVVNGVNKGWLEKWKKNGWTTGKGDKVKNVDLWKSLDELLQKETVSVVFVKVKGHSGNAFNELADEEAKKMVEVAKGYLKK